MSIEEGKTHWTDDELQTLRGLARELTGSLGFSQGEASKDADIPGSTFSQFLSGKYPGDNNEVAKRVSRWIVAKREELRLAATAPPEPGFVRTSVAEKVLPVLRAAQALGDIGVVTGPPGCGKTVAARHYRDSGARTTIVTGSPAVATASAIMQMLLKARGQMPKGRSTASKLQLTVDVREQFPAGWLIVVDEAQHLNMDALEELRAIHDDTGVGLVLMGNETVLSRIQGNNRSPAFAQLYSRAGVRAAITGASDEDVEAVLMVMGVAEPEVVKVGRAVNSKDSLRVAVKTTRRAQMVAAGAKQSLNPEHLRLAYRQLGGTLAR